MLMLLRRIEEYLPVDILGRIMKPEDAEPEAEEADDDADDDEAEAEADDDALGLAMMAGQRIMMSKT